MTGNRDKEVARGNVRMERGGIASMVGEFIKPTSVPFTYCFLGLTLRLAFTKRRFYRVESSYQRLLEEGEGGMDAFLHDMEQSFQVLRNEIDRIEEGQEDMRRAVLPCVRDQLGSYRCFMVFMSGFREPLDEANREDYVGERNKCCISMLAQDPDTTSAIQRLVADFIGVPTGRLLHDLRNLENLLEQSIGPSTLTRGERRPQHENIARP